MLDLDQALPDDSVEGWLEDSLNTKSRPIWMEHEGIRIRVHEWGVPGMPGVVLVHGGAAHSRWWDHIAPSLAARRHVVALDLSGHGDSDRRTDGYSVAAWARETIAAAGLVSQAGPPALIGHSMGGVIVARATREPNTQLSGIALLDTTLSQIGEEEARRRARRAGRAATFPSQDAAIQSFKTRPPGGAHRHLPILVRHVARTSVRQESNGWTWKIDRKVFVRDSFTPEDIQPVSYPALVVAAEHGLLSDERANLIAAQLGSLASTTRIPLAGHHLMLDQPAALIACLDTALALWQPNSPASDHPEATMPSAG